MKKISLILSILVIGLFLVVPAFASETQEGNSDTAVQAENPVDNSASASEGQPSEENAILAVWQKTGPQFPESTGEATQPSPIDSVNIDLTVDENDKNAQHVSQ